MNFDKSKFLKLKSHAIISGCAHTYAKCDDQNPEMAPDFLERGKGVNFAFPSLYEDFGLPLLEAIACGVPVIAANNSSIPQIVGDAALLFGAQNLNEISAAMSRVLVDNMLRGEIDANHIGSRYP